ncbi:MAG: hypothetical protein ABI904_20870 [Chloroflexota bacterium]
MDTLSFDIQEAHKYFSANCFNKTWDAIDKDGERSSEENLSMLHTAIASLWHWTQRQDVQPEQLSVGYWQVSRVYNLIDQPHNAKTYGMLALKYAQGLKPFYKGYAYETLARAEMILNSRFIMNVHLEKAREALEQIENEEEKQLLLKDLETIR